MILPFNRLNVDISCLGNHELDHGIDKAKELIAKTNCPWIMSNLLDKNDGGRPIAGVAPYHVLEHQGFRIGFCGFADSAWTDQFNPEIDCDALEYVDYNECLQKHASMLRCQ